MAAFSKRLRVALASHPSAHNLPLARVYTGEMSKCLYGLPDPHSPNQTTVLPLSLLLSSRTLPRIHKLLQLKALSLVISLSRMEGVSSTSVCSLNPHLLRVTIQTLFLSEALLGHT